MGNRHSNSKHCKRNHETVQKTEFDNETRNQNNENQAESNDVADQNMYITPRSRDDAISSQLGSECISSVTISNDSTSHGSMSTSGAQHIIRESVNNYHFKDSSNNHIGDSIHCYGAVSFVTTSQSNVQITNQQITPIVHDFGNLNF